MLFLIICFVGLLHFGTVSCKPTDSKSRIPIPSNINKEYRLQYYVQASWYNAYLFCRDNGMRLATINSQQEQDYLSDLITELGLTNDWWVAGSELAYAGRFSWYSNGNLFKYTNWDEGRPGSSGNLCVQFRASHKWFDTACSSVISFVCEVDI